MPTENFEDSTYIFTFSNMGGWARTNAVSAYGGSWSLKSPVTSDSGVSQAVAMVPPGAVSIQFWYRVSSEQGYDYFRFFLDDTEQLAISGDTSWVQTPVYSLTGVTTFSFAYTKDSSSFSGSDAAWIDDVTINILAGPPRLQPPSLAAVNRASRW